MTTHAGGPPGKGRAPGLASRGAEVEHAGGGRTSTILTHPDTAAALPRRIRMTRRTPWRHLAPDAVIVDRTGRWGNPYPVKVYGRERAIELYRGHLAEHPDLAAAVRRELAGRDLACWCSLDQPCHADVLLEVASGGVR